MKLMRRIGALCGALLIAGCAISPGVETTSADRCDFPRYHLAVEVAEDPYAAERLTYGQSFANAISDAYEDVHLGARETVSPSMLFMSGGSQNGAFGAGFLDGWAKDNGGRLPRFKVVTGISTGAILSTFAFLNEPAIPLEKYSLAREDEVLERIGSMSLTGGAQIIRRGAAGDLAPLRLTLQTLMDDARMRRVADEAADGRHLYVGAVDIDTAQAVVFDMTKMATRYAQTDRNNTLGLRRIRDCYVEAIMASSTVPMAALPVFIDNRMYIDGGARFGVFSDELGDAIQEKSRALDEEFKALPPNSSLVERALDHPPNVFVVINGTLAAEPQCSKADEALCPGGVADGNADWRGRHKDWKLTDLGLRSVSILINQGYRFSSATLFDRVTERGFVPHLVKINPDLGQFSFTLDHPTLGSGTNNCLDWEKIDKTRDAPLEFHPRYMRCLIAYGADKAKRVGWADLE